MMFIIIVVVIITIMVIIIMIIVRIIIARASEASAVSLLCYRTYLSFSHKVMKIRSYLPPAATTTTDSVYYSEAIFHFFFSLERVLFLVWQCLDDDYAKSKPVGMKLF